MDERTCDCGHERGDHKNGRGLCRLCGCNDFTRWGDEERGVAEAEARGFAAGIEAAAKVARGFIERIEAQPVFYNGQTYPYAMVERAIRALTPKREGT